MKFFRKNVEEKPKETLVVTENGLTREEWILVARRRIDAAMWPTSLGKVKDSLRAAREAIDRALGDEL